MGGRASRGRDRAHGRARRPPGRLARASALGASSTPPTVIVLPSVAEQFGQVLVEGMACARPVIAVRLARPGVRSSRRGDGLARRGPTTATGSARRWWRPSTRPGSAAAAPAVPRVALERYAWPALAGGSRRSTRLPGAPPDVRVCTLYIFSRPATVATFRIRLRAPAAHREHPMHAAPRDRHSQVGLLRPPAMSTMPAASAMVARLNGEPSHETSSVPSSRWRTSSTAGGGRGPQHGRRRRDPPPTPDELRVEWSAATSPPGPVRRRDLLPAQDSERAADSRRC